MSPEGLGLALELDVYNPNSFQILAQNVSGTLELGNGVELGRGRAQPAERDPGEGLRDGRKSAGRHLDQRRRARALRAFAGAGAVLVSRRCCDRR